MNTDPSNTVGSGHPSRDRKFCSRGSVQLLAWVGTWRQDGNQSWRTQRKGKSRVLSQHRVRTGRRSELNTLKTQVR